ncbi:IclR family transcriptional regulator [Agrobacterium deltaense]|uniref:IclR family transcriptional regulator n=1 Tax=Agrobacterium deltaense TaxID=1183412 RepID=UPI001C6E1607|nr:IclR family transcriptional regulator [Agrobacterium deltaense]MBW9075674.1 IclR family transcriptional regulator [Agrobacterium deltaense]
MSNNLSLEKGLSILALLKDAREPLGVREIARRLELSPAVAQRLLNTLAAQSYVEQEENSRRYQIGYAVLGLAQHVFQRGRLLTLARAELQGLAAGGCFNGFLGVRRGSTGIYVLAIQSDSPVVIRAHPGEAMPLHSTALGKALLLSATDEQVARVLGNGPFQRLTDRTVTDLDQLIQQLHIARSLGYATAISENVEGVISLGAPIYDAGGSLIAAISVAFPRAVYPKVKITDVAQYVLAAANRISKGLGFDELMSTEEKDNPDVT